jgi:transposase-like protein
VGKRGRKPDLRIEVGCPNGRCLKHQLIGQGNIISNGKYQLKDGTWERRFRCTTCGNSFCSRSDTFFYGFRFPDPENKVLSALKLVADGHSLRSIARKLGIKLDTVRRWFRAAYQQREKVDPLITKRLNFSEDSLDLFWYCAQDYSFRRRKDAYLKKKARRRRELKE